jgi:hypothetical protein
MKEGIRLAFLVCLVSFTCHVYPLYHTTLCMPGSLVYRPSGVVKHVAKHIYDFILEQ